MNADEARARDTNLHGLTRTAVNQLLHLKVTHDLVGRVVDEKRDDWRGFVEQLHCQRYPIRGVGVIVTPPMLGQSEYEADDGGFLHSDEDVAPDEIVSNLNDYPLDAASSAYAFSIVETYGNDVAHLYRPGSVRARGSWHEAVKYDLEAANGELGVRAMAAFAKPFGADFLSVKPESVIRLVAIRNARNDYVHRRDTDIAFSRFLAFSLAIVLQIHFLKAADQGELRFYPWEAFDEKWSRQGDTPRR